MSTQTKDELLNQRIDDLYKIVTKKDKTKWYKSFSNIISILALAISIGFSIYSIISGNAELDKTVKAQGLENINNLLNEILEIQDQINAHNNNQVSQASFTSQGLLNSRRIITTDKLVNEINELDEKDVPTSVFLIVGDMFKNDAKYDKAKTFFIKAMNRADNRFDKIACYRSLGVIYSDMNAEYYNRDSANNYWKLCFEDARELNKDVRNYTNAYTYHYWASTENYYDKIEKKQISNLMDSAIFYYELLPDKNVNKFGSIELLKDMKRFLHLKGNAINSSNQVLLGKWEGKFNTQKIIMTTYENQNGFYYVLEFHSGTYLRKKMQGYLIAKDENKFQFDLAGMSMSMPYNIQGFMEAKFTSENFDQLQITLREIGNPASRISLKRI